MERGLQGWAAGLGERRASRQGQGRLSQVTKLQSSQSSMRQVKQILFPFTVACARAHLNKIFRAPIQGFFYPITLIHMLIHKRQI